MRSVPPSNLNENLTAEIFSCICRKRVCFTRDHPGLSSMGAGSASRVPPRQ